MFLKKEKTQNSLIASTTSDLEEESYQGLVGLRNIANTCYMNSALQALTHIPELSKYFLDFDDVIESSTEKLPLTRAYCRLIKEIWEQPSDGRRFSSLVPRMVLNSIRNVYPMFRGFQQHDTQEFLRCFMDQLHEELKISFPSTKGTAMPSRFENGKDGELNFFLLPVDSYQHFLSQLKSWLFKLSLIIKRRSPDKKVMIQCKE